MLMPAATMAAAQHPCAAAPATTTPYVCSPKDALIAWYKGEFAAANAIIDALCAHLAQIGAPAPSGYEAVFAAIHRRRINWIPVLQWQTYYSVADVVDQLRRVTDEQMLLNKNRNDSPKYQHYMCRVQPPPPPPQIHQAVVKHMDVDRQQQAVEEGEVLKEEAARRDDTHVLIKVELENTATSSSVSSANFSNDDAKPDSNGHEENCYHNPDQTQEYAAETEIDHDEQQPPPEPEKADEHQQQDEPELVHARAVAAEMNNEPADDEYSHPSPPASPDRLQIPDRHPSPSTDADADGASAGSSEPHEEEQQRGQHSPVVGAAPTVTSGIICAGHHDDCDSRRDRISVCKGFVAKEHNKGHMVNIVKGLKVYEDAFTDSELARLADCITQLRDAGQSGQLSGETYILFNKQLKGNKREIIQFGVPVFQPTNTEETTSNIEPIPALLQDVIDHLIQWRLIPASKNPNGCIVNFYEKDEHSQPYFKPPHLDNPLATLLLHETTMAFGKALTCDKDGNYKGSLNLHLKEGSLVVMRGNSADMARHVICPSSNPRVSITFVKVRPTTNTNAAVSSPTKAATTLLNPESEGAAVGTPHSLVPAWSVGMAVQSPIVILPPARPIPMNAIAKRTSRSTGTGVFLPWALGSKKYIKQLPPRIQKRRLPAMPQPLGMQLEKASQIRCLAM